MKLKFQENNNEVLSNNSVSNNSVIEDAQSINEPETSNGLENFEIEEETPELFNSDVEEKLPEESLELKETDSIDEDDLEIPAFLRRQKN